MKYITILGSTGSIGTQALEVVRDNPSIFKVSVLSALKNSALLIQQAKEFRPEVVVICDESQYQTVKDALSSLNIKVLAGEESLSEVASYLQSDIVLTALMGSVGLKPTIAAIKAGKSIALANKETLVVAGEYITALAAEYQVKILPVDSEHSAIFQCLVGEAQNEIEKIYLTASGGPFLGKGKDFLSTIKKEQALKHPNWVMGAKITIDSATLMNKGLEVIEAKWLFDLDVDQVDVIVHPQSIIHSIVQFTDGSMKAQMGVPDMKLPIQYAINYPDRLKNNFKRFNFLDYPNFSFQQADRETFRNLDLAFKALRKGGNMPCILNAANEIVVESFLNDKIGFLEMSDVIEQCMEEISFIEKPQLTDYLETDKHSRILAGELVTKSSI
ncbi:1-deoxy-D-xylulose 5-phosphate reductoisomerase [Pedobacter psychrotolerans]|uniref:1-deoxy-D-xylulose 5-phosphate reductoisomerase n=1 Tax=Pedobacter psychrotolerans TaxID=1843235 RepID=A0A4R2HN07_9SPHI|nr:1-deoxy-D-xylulose-5-phosphate reductoisomerase [Pedobacter psychrotolerans]TCO31102.1 1-deoxy-D-xylulose 5-phosphate reductoisomerase [Pedobacter psychrotolerans]GGE42200.1 1-deoxy-D-xylulose 5-phosphate reductoisomerase [Pedobacter psychrotolerans]